jgi:hypothetical protein
LVLYSELNAHPVVYNEINVYPPYYLFDTLDLMKPAPDTVFVNLNLRKQDSATVYLVDINDPNSIWIDHHTDWNDHRGHLPWSLGVATFDGMDETGWPYAINTGLQGYADYLTSKPLVMNFPASDSLYFSFAYQAQGFGDVPESNDSLVLDFYNVLDSQWETVWSTPGSAMEPFDLVHLPITELKYLQAGFQFRFKNYGGLSGDLDNWHIDYVWLRRNSSVSDTNIVDFAVVYPIPTLLKEYSAIPWKHFRNNPQGLISDSLNLTVRNSSAIAGNTQNATLRIFDGANLIQDYSIPGATLTTELNYSPKTTYTTSRNLEALDPLFEFPTTSSNDTSYCFDYYFQASVPFPQLLNMNDTVFGSQCFSNYYAYDDGSAEQAYGVNGEQSRLAYQFTTLEPDSLVAIQIHFVPTVFDHSDKLFLLTVWDDNNGQPGNVIFEDNFFTAQSPQYAGVQDGFWHYYFINQTDFNDTLKVGVSGTFYVGWRQLDPQRLNVGFDKNTNNKDKIFYSIDLGATWLNSSFDGSLMIRPVFSSKLDYLLEDETFDTEELTLYPNPVEDEINFSFSSVGYVQVIGTDGKIVLEKPWSNNVSLTELNPGFYLVRVVASSGTFSKTFKIVKR